MTGNVAAVPAGKWLVTDIVLGLLALKKMLHKLALLSTFTIFIFIVLCTDFYSAYIKIVSGTFKYII